MGFGKLRWDTYFWFMADGGENVKIPKAYVNKLREIKKTTGVPMAVFICQAIDEKLINQQKQNDHVQSIQKDQQ